MSGEKKKLENLKQDLGNSRASSIFSENTKINLERFSSQLERLQDLENSPIRYFLEAFPFPFAMLNENLKYLLHSSKWPEVLESSKKDLTGAPLEFSGFHVSQTSLQVYEDVLAGKYHTDKGRDLFMTHKKRRIHIHWMLWKKGEEPGGILLIANLNSLS